MSEIRVITAGRLIDGTGQQVQRGVQLLVQDGTITKILSAGEDDAPYNSAVTDLSHCTLLPALVDCSVSLQSSPSIVDTPVSPAMDEPARQETLLRHLRYCYSHGVLGVAESGLNRQEIDRLLQSEAARWEQMEIRTSGPQAQPPEALQPAAAGNDFIRVYYSEPVEDTAHPPTLLTEEELTLLIQHNPQKKVVVVVNGKQKVQEALAAGCDGIEQGYGMGKANLQTMAAKGILWIPNAVRAKNELDGASGGGEVCCRFSARYVAPGKPIPGAKEFWEKTLAEQLEQLDMARKFGVPVGVGTGGGCTGILHGESMVEEMKLFCKAGFSIEETIRSASTVGADFFNMRQVCPLTPGNKATFLVTRGTVKQLPRKLAYLEDIYINGIASPAYSKHPRSA